MTAKVNYTPEGYSSATPYLIINGAADAIEFYRKVMGASCSGCSNPAAKSGAPKSASGTPASWRETRLHGALVRGRSVDCRYRYVVQPEIHAELSAVMDAVIKNKAPQNCKSRQRKHGFASVQ